MTDDYNIACAACPACNGSGYIGADLCECLLAHRIHVFMTYGGFAANIIDFVSDAAYLPPVFESGDEYLAQYIADPEQVIDRGRSLYIYSQDAGRGKTVLAHYIVKCLCTHFAKTENYRPSMSFAFQSANAFLNNAVSYADDELWRSTVYVLDDVGNEKRATKQYKEAVAPALQELLQYRRNEQLPTIFTSNYAPEALGSLYEGRIDSLLEIGVDGVIHGEALGSLYEGRIDSLLEIGVDGVIHGDRFRQIEVGGGEDLRTMGSAWDSDE